MCTSHAINIDFNVLAGLARRPIAHTYSSILEISPRYNNYQDFLGDFESILAKINYEFTFLMDAI